ncbi:DNA-binding protein [Bacterioplanes sanyensis]|uniref:DNA-binding protein n=1 Tax=Bacterioplanes sanyensis TaxID=1249553 RepID=A0A222FQ22_9GAMM|nr:hypothetical protein [Bacterioplanes sanyensis]ASP40343.1 DNA-binding protein [Bacterioplanes sanyensis]
MERIVDRFVLLANVEDVKMPWLQKQTGISAGRWHKVKTGQNEMRASDVDALVKVWPEYAYWLVTGEELPESGQISPMSRNKKNRSRLKVYLST